MEANKLYSVSWGEVWNRELIGNNVILYFHFLFFLLTVFEPYVSNNNHTVEAYLTDTPERFEMQGFKWFKRCETRLFKL